MFILKDDATSCRSAHKFINFTFENTVASQCFYRGDSADLQMKNSNQTLVSIEIFLIISLMHEAVFCIFVSHKTITEK